LNPMVQAAYAPQGVCACPICPIKIASKDQLHPCQTARPIGRWGFFVIPDSQRFG
jgi:hypothetical protein